MARPRIYNSPEEEEAALAANLEAAFNRYKEHEVVIKAHRAKIRAVGLTGMWREQGSFWVPDRQSKLDTAMLGQLMYCPNCGTEHPATTSGEFTCGRCRAHYAISLGLNPNTNEVAPVRVDRWK